MAKKPVSPSAKSLSQKSVEGTALLVATRFLVRLIGFVSVSITARLLTPEDFGVVGAASLVIALFAILNQIGLSEYVVRSKQVDPDELQTMWTIRLSVSSAIALGIYMVAPFAAAFLQEPRLEEILRILCIASVLGAMRSPAAEFFNRNMQYTKLLFLTAADKVVSVVVTIAVAYYLRTYWALVWGQLAGMLFAILSSQIARPFMPRLTFKKVSKVRSFAFWTLLVGLNGYGIRQVDEWIAKRSSDAAAFGAYHVARDLCRLFVAEIIAPAGQVFFPAVSKVQDDKDKLSEVIGRFAGAAFIAAFAVAAGIAAVSEELVYLLLGYQWGQAIPYMPYVAAGTAAIIVGELFQGLYVIADRQDISTRFRFARLLLLLLGCSLAAQVSGSLLAIAQALAVISIVSVTLELVWLFSPKRYHVSIAARVWRPGLAATAMYFLVQSVATPAAWPLIVVLGVKVLVGVLSFILVTGTLWLISGRPTGGESEFLDRIADYRR